MTTNRKTKIRIDSVHKSFGQLEVLKGVSAEVMQSEMVCLIGSSGSGKTTLLRCLNLLEVPTSGHIWIDGMEITAKGVSMTDVRRETGMVFQHFNLFPHMTVLKNIMLAPVKVQPRKLCVCSCLWGQPRKLTLSYFANPDVIKEIV